MPRGKRTRRSLAWKIENTRVSRRRYTPDHPAFPHANGFNGFLRSLPGDRLFVSVVERNLFAQLDTSIGVSGRYDFAVRFRHAFVFRIESVHRIPRPTFVTIAKRPSFKGAGWRGLWI
ncbi:hypothetical protein [Bradyrhizobium sp.]|jgi:hypothetical protein|uniref:hypothetical protein n=1 Tax=Bradyrhizobium sp. TaxID=376 RepID=UPI003C14F33F